mmetsp:Transcript_25760/g.39569  ORF Transcript_25760/g.39569 Transcript_25760/m.39569 type:complete len:328 (+) Transcript_25760:278-1261(+)|eukprot:CAMPEP_0195287862 /NCGR_PEP_ID=MMETSP0707-20130614/4759_1 /TAXON_ID=33640 /ORGANISM="Asterionellopsis glacialis, Strain CCMP134" /LENGTH=327 /DNA_ID=CAMNT_0040347665 /DNA_START=180 /DNA_END=1163 /DNA_ORIENTATION=+
MLGYKPWKAQKIDTSRGPPTDYTQLTSPLPTPPAGMKWERNEQNREWVLVPRNGNPSNSQSVHQQQLATEVEKAEKVEAEQNNSDEDQDEGHPLKEETVSNDDADNDSAESDPSKDYPNLSFFKNNKDEKMVVGIDYLEHTILPTDTFQGICLCYKISAIKLRQTNQFSGTNLKLAPTKLIIPLRGHPNKDKIKMQDRNSPDFKIQTMVAEFPSLREKEVRSYLEIADWNVEDAMTDAREDLRWERSNTALWTLQQNYTASKGMPALPVKVRSRKSKEQTEIKTTAPRLDVHTAVPVQHSLLDEKDEEPSDQRTEVELSPLMTPLLS